MLISFTSTDNFAVGAMKVSLQSVNFLLPIIKISEFSECVGWVPWRAALGISSGGGGYVMEYIFFVMFSVGVPPFRYSLFTITHNFTRLFSLHVPAS